MWNTEKKIEDINRGMFIKNNSYFVYYARYN